MEATTETRPLGIRFGAMTDEIDKQLRDQGFFLPCDDSEYYQLIADAILRLWVNDYLSDAEAKRARKRVLRDICKAARALAATPTGGDPA